MLYYAALRSKELRYLHVEDVDIRNRIVHVKNYAGIKGKAERSFGGEKVDPYITLANQATLF